MSRYLLIESRDTYEFADVAYFYDLADGLAKEGHGVTLFLVQNGVFPARPSAHSDRLTRLAQDGVEILADDFSLRERGIPTESLTKGVSAVPIGRVVDLLADGSTRALWH